MIVEAVLWDFGGVITESPFDAFARYERANGLPEGAIRRVNSCNPDGNAWALFERSQIDRAAFCRQFEAEAAALGYRLDAGTVLDLIQGPVRPRMIAALRSVAGRYRTACLTNNMRAPGEDGPPARQTAEAMALFDIVVESREAGVRKPEPAFYRLACARLGVQPQACVFLDDLGINLKPARAMGMVTVKVESETQALADLEAALGHPLS
ncbi:MAG: HAD-IA family hydrolase [Alphaproteobacteria bacterium]|nr:HAD-IA family hydrolase [Alphaproteobacteria bacterium]